MGYDLHITRADFWAENEGHEIAVEEWLRLVAENASLRLDVSNGPCFAIVTIDDDDSSRWLDWRDGNVYTKSPDSATLEKMLAVAEALGGRVQGDDGEHYQSVEDLPQRSSGELSNRRDPDELPAYLQRERLWNWLSYALIALAILGAFVARQFL